MRGSSHTLVQSAGNVFHISLDFTYIRDLTQVKSHLSVLSAGKHFSVKPSLHTHQRSYTEEKLNTCLECGKCFSEKPFTSYMTEISYGGKRRIGDKRGE
ncbi:unnamed protein product [Staurois parvus]|uniref:Uncharacterized protein n=1 Tax=Staurois parvus TaxID=386267 RepID=A0ABN9ED18_9NEOB|nr:unnamed protein product [Staurois parvus]